MLAPPPKSPQNTAYADTSPRFNPFDKSGFAEDALPTTEAVQIGEMTRTDSQVFLPSLYRIIFPVSKNVTIFFHVESGNRKLHQLLCSTRT